MISASFHRVSLVSGSLASSKASASARTLAAFGLAVALILSRGAIASAAEEGWSLSKLNPFGSPSSSSAKSKAARSPHSASAGKPKSAPRSTLNSMTQGTSKFMGKTKEVLMPWSKPAPKTTKMSVSRTTPAKKSRAASVQKAAWYEFWKSEPEQDKGPQTVNEFLALPRPE